MALDTNMGWGIGAVPGLLGNQKTRGSISRGLFGGGPQYEQMQRFNPQQQQGFSQVLQQALSGMQNPQEGFEPMAQQARSQFQSQTVPSIAERFTSWGGGGQRSSDFQGALGRAGANLEEGLASQGSQYGLQRQGQLQQLLGMGLTPQFDTFRNAPTQGLVGNMAAGAAEQIPALIKMLMMGGM